MRSATQLRTCGILLLASLSLLGCKTMEGQEGAGVPDARASTAASGLATADTQGAAVGLPSALAAGGVLTDSRGQQWQTLILRSYVAASGRTCHNVRFTSVGSGSTADRVVCEQAGGWVLVPPLRQEPGGPALNPDMRLSDREVPAGSTAG